MRLKRFTASFLAALLICIPVLAQTPAPPQTQKGDKSQKVDKGLEKKALALLDELVGEAMSLKLVENRIYALTAAADLFWNRNEDRARALLAEPVNQFMPIEQPCEPSDARAAQQMGIRMELRTQLLQNLATRDSRMALDFLRASRLPDMRKMFGGKFQVENKEGALDPLPDFDKQFEMQLAVSIAENDPRMAMQI